MPALPVVAKWRYIRYTGSNSAELNAEVPLNIISEEDGVLVCECPPGGRFWTINAGDYCLYYEREIAEVDISTTEFERRWRCDRTCDEITAQVATPLRSFGVSAVPELAASASDTVSVTLAPDMSDAGYGATAQLFAGVDISALQVNSVTVVDEDTVDVVVENTGLVSLSGANVMVVAFA